MTQNSSSKKSQRSAVELTDPEKLALDRLYIEDGAWTPQETQRHLSSARLLELRSLGIVDAIDTHIGPLIVLLRQGRYELYGLSLIHI